MCIGIPMQVISLEPGFAQVTGRGETRRVRTALVGDCQTGDWLLVFLDDARELISPERAQEVNATLDLLASALGQGDAPEFPVDLGFALPSAMDLHTLQQMTQS